MNDLPFGQLGRTPESSEANVTDCSERPGIPAQASTDHMADSRVRWAGPDVGVPCGGMGARQGGGRAGRLLRFADSVAMMTPE